MQRELVKSRQQVVKIKADETDSESGIFTGYASVFDNVDRYGDKVIPGAFAQSLKDWDASPLVIPAYWVHQTRSDPHNNIGHVLEAKEDERGLWVKVQLDVSHNDTAAYVHRLLKSGRVAQMSFMYDVVEGAWIDGEKGGYYELRQLALHEVSVVPLGVNDETSILTVKALQVEAAKAVDENDDDASTESTDAVRDAAEAVKTAIAVLSTASDELIAALDASEDDDTETPADDAASDSDSLSTEGKADGQSDAEEETAARRKSAAVAALKIHIAHTGRKAV